MNQQIQVINDVKKCRYIVSRVSGTCGVVLAAFLSARTPTDWVDFLRNIPAAMLAISAVG